MGNKRQKNIFNEHIEYVAEYKDSIKFQYNGNNFEGGLSWAKKSAIVFKTIWINCDFDFN